jgi:proline iminopeptidase
MPKILFALATLMPAMLCAEVPHRTGNIQTAEVDLGYEIFGTPNSAIAVIAVIAVNGGPGLSHAYMVQNDLWQRVAAHRLVVLYDQRGTGASKQLRANAPKYPNSKPAAHSSR